MAKNLQYILSETTHSISNNNFNHCSTLASINEKILLAWYSGSFECHNDQRVWLMRLEENTGITSLEENTGNPVLFNDSDGKTFILYSEFAPHQSIKGIDKWKFCNLYIREIFEDSMSDRIKLADESEHLLGRCSPIVENGVTHIPLYNELDEYSVIYSGDGSEYVKSHVFGESEIQPAIYCENGLKAFTRNFKSKRMYSRFHSIEKQTANESNIPNNNSSLAVLKIDHVVFCVYNNTTNKTRKNLTLGYINNNKVFPFRTIDQYGSYPTIIKHHDKIVISYTGYYNNIKVRTFDIDTLCNEVSYRRSFWV